MRTGMHANGQRYARMDLSERGISATVQGTGRDDEQAAADLRWQLRRLAELADEAAEKMPVSV